MNPFRMKLYLLVFLFAIGVPAYALDQNMEVDILVARITGLLKAEKSAEALPLFEQLEGMNAKLPESFDYYYIDTLDRTGKAEKALGRSETYLKKYGKAGKYYGQVIEIVARRRPEVEAIRSQAELDREQAEAAARVAAAEALKKRQADEEAAHRRKLAAEADERARRLAAEEEERKRRLAQEAAERKRLALEEATRAAVLSIEQGMVELPGETSFVLSRTEVTQKQWRGIMGDDPLAEGSEHKRCDECPVTAVSWHDAKAFIARLNARSKGGYRLPREQEWVFACRAGKKEHYCGGNAIDAVAWHKGNSGDRVRPVGSKLANAWGLYDMSGNAFEWTDDCEQNDCSKRMVRGGSWYSSRERVHVEHGTRLAAEATRQDDGVGIRLARTLSPAESDALKKRYTAEAEAKERARLAMSDYSPLVGEMIGIPFKTPFLMGRTEVTQKQWREVMGENPPKFALYGKVKDCDDCPVTRVTLNEVKEFIAKLNARTQGTYRLPTEMEWEYACRAGMDQDYCGSDNVNAVAWYKDNSGATEHPRAQKQSNAWGLYDMTGNVWELTGDCSDEKCRYSIARGGSSMTSRNDVRAVSRRHLWNGNFGFDLGFRLARTLP